MQRLKIGRVLAFIAIAIAIVLWSNHHLETVAQNALQSTIPDRYVGIWKGMGHQNNPPADWSMVIAIVPGAPGQIVGAIAYPSIPCGGELTLQHARNNAVRVLEEITYGQACAYNGRGQIALRWRGNNNLEYSWELPGSAITATGSLNKVSR